MNKQGTEKIRLKRLLRKFDIPLNKAIQVIGENYGDVKLKPTTMITQKEYHDILTEYRTEKIYGDDCFITNEWIPKMELYRNHLQVQFEKLKGELRNQYDWVNNDFIKKTKGVVDETINNPVVFWVYWRIKNYRWKLDLVKQFLKGKIPFKNYRNQIEKSKGQKFMLYQLENLFRNIKTKKI